MPFAQKSTYPCHSLAKPDIYSGKTATLSQRTLEGSKKRKLREIAPVKTAASVAQFDESGPPGMIFILAELSGLREQVAKLGDRELYKVRE
ncbi:hypothetical protein SBOR_6137 [Sclerotinia borealis F-4128]|uniref:Uncharacterized protein n=1 Tax=Sclerotinia borealis (strain F-4128) TaxID=1432307 RepID=W9CCD9_SCLBF|nr:hypothetical protein SBOR_6137 [Sclerotinia borealis F-4128]